jgi:hypothetical protein
MSIDVQPLPKRRHRSPTLLLIFIIFFAPIMLRAAQFSVSDLPRSWRDADWSSTGTLPRAADYKPARVLVYTAQTGSWKGVFSIHSWVVMKRANARAWTRYDVVGWGNPVRSDGWPADGRWYGNMPAVLADISGEAAEKIIPKIEAAVKDYQYRNAGDYRVWPGPNSNSFTAAILRNVPDLGVMLPSNAVGRDFRDRFYAGVSDSRTGLEINLWGYAGAKIGWVEGLEINLLGLVAGLDVRHPAIKLPGFGRIGIEPPVAIAKS